MKLELLLTLKLLAIMALLWVYVDPTPEHPQFQELREHNPSSTEYDSDEIAHLETEAEFDTGLRNAELRFNPLPELPSTKLVSSPEIQLASYTQEVQEPAEPEEQELTFQFASFAPTEDQPASILVQAAQNLADSPPIACSSRMKINLFDQQVIGTGTYFNAGQGSGLSRLELAFSVDENTSLNVSQICDGKFFYRVEQLGKKRKIEFLDLSEFANDDGSGLADNPTQWLSRSGTISLLRNLGTAFDFAEPAHEPIAGLNMIHLRGQWKPAAIKNILGTRSANLDISKGVKWRQLPPQVPHGVDVYLGNDEFLPLFPYRIVFFQFDPETNAKHAVVTMELFEVEKVSSLSPDLFRVDTDNSQQVDMSNAYQERIKQMVDAAAAQANPTQTR